MNHDNIGLVMVPFFLSLLRDNLDISIMPKNFHCFKKMAAAIPSSICDIQIDQLYGV